VKPGFGKKSFPLLLQFSTEGMLTVQPEIFRLLSMTEAYDSNRQFIWIARARAFVSVG
jgi:hypothetical protein